MPKAYTYLLRYPSASLLFVQLLGIVLYPFMEQLSEGRAIVGAFGIVVLAMSLRMVRSSPNIQWIAFTQAACILALTVALEFESNTALSILLAALESSFYFYAAGGLIAYMMEDERASTDELFAVGALYPAGLGLRPCFSRLPTAQPWQFHGGDKPRGAAHLDGTAVPEFYRPVGGWPE